MSTPPPIVGIDVGKATCHAAILHDPADHTTAVQLQAPRLDLAGILVEHLAAGPAAAIAIELTGNLALPILQDLEPTHHRLFIAQHTDSGALRQLLRLRRKTDKLDAVLIARLAALLLNPDTAGLVGALLTPWPQLRASILGRSNARHLQRLIGDRTRLSNRLEAVTSTVARANYEALAELLDRQIAIAEADLLADPSPEVLLLETLPLVTRRRAAILAAAIGAVSRFPSADHLVAYCRLKPQHAPQSGSTTGKPKRPRGLTLLAAELHTLALTTAAHADKPTTGVLGATYRRVEGRHDGRVAMWAVKRRLIRMAWGVLTSQQPHHGAQALDEAHAAAAAAKRERAAAAARARRAKLKEEACQPTSTATTGASASTLTPSSALSPATGQPLPTPATPAPLLTPPPAAAPATPPS